MKPIRLWLTKSLSSRLTLLVLAVTCVGWLFFCAVLLLEVHEETTKLLDAQLESHTDLLWQHLANEDDKPPVGSAMIHNSLGLVYSLYDGQQGLLSTNLNPPLPYQDAPTDEPLNLDHADKHWRLCVHVKSGKQLIVGVPLSYHHHILYEIIEHLGQTALLALLLLIPLLRLAIRRGLAPLKAIDQELAMREPNNLNPLAIDVPDEVLPLRNRLNELFAQVANTLARERRFTADAAHELRTPLAGLRVHIELAQQSAREETRTKALSKALEGVDRTTRLISQLLALSRLEQSTELAFSTVALPELAAQALADAGLSNQAPVLNVDNPQPIRGNPDLILLLLRNLLDNALGYGGESTGISIAIMGTSLSVSDHGPGVSDETLTRLGERFFRPAGQPKPGAGLGLSIVQQIAQLHGAALRFANSPAGGFCVSIDFPA